MMLCSLQNIGKQIGHLNYRNFKTKLNKIKNVVKLIVNKQKKFIGLTPSLIHIA